MQESKKKIFKKANNAVKNINFFKKKESMQETKKLKKKI